MKVMDSPQQAEERFRRFFREALESGRVWGLFDGVGWANWWDKEEWDDPTIPFWSSHDEATACAKSGLTNYEVKHVMLSEFVTDFLANFEENGFWVGVNLTPQRTGVQVPPAVLKDELSYPVP